MPAGTARVPHAARGCDPGPALAAQLSVRLCRYGYGTDTDHDDDRPSNLPLDTAATGSVHPVSEAGTGSAAAD